MIRIGLIQTEEELQQVFRLRYDVYVEELGAAMEHADHQHKFLHDEWNATADIIGAWHNDELVGCVRLNRCGNTNLAEYEPFFHPFVRASLLNRNPNSVSVGSKLVVAKRMRGLNLGTRLCQALYEQMHIRGGHLSYATCRTNLVEMYRHFGWRICGPSFFHHEAGLMIPIVLLVQDHEYLRQIKSPFANICARYPINQKQARVLRAICANEALARCA